MTLEGALCEPWGLFGALGSQGHGGQGPWARAPGRPTEARPGDKKARGTRKPQAQTLSIEIRISCIFRFCFVSNRPCTLLRDYAKSTATMHVRDGIEEVVSR